MAFGMQFNRGTSAMQHYVGLRPMFDVEVMNADSRLVLGDQDSLPSPSNVARALSSLYKEITGMKVSNIFEDQTSVFLIYNILLSNDL